MAQENSTDAGCVEMGIWILRSLGKLFDVFREKGFYDSSLILVLADHGHHGHKGHFPKMGEPTLPGKARPFLWVKPVGSEHPFSSSPLPTSHSRVSNLLKAAVSHVVTKDEVDALLKSDDRVYRVKSGMEWEDWHVRGDGRVSVVDVLARELDVQDMRAIEPGRWLPLTRP